MTRHANAARDLAALLADASPDVAQANADTLLALRADIAADLANAHVAAMLRTTDGAQEAAALMQAGALGGAVPLGVQPAAQSIVLPYPPSANRYWRSYGGRIVVSADAKAYKAGVWMQAQQARLQPFSGPVAVYVHAYRPRKVGDLDNANKVLLDALCGIAYQDDAQIVELHSWRHDDAQNPRVEVEVRAVQP